MLDLHFPAFLPFDEYFINSQPTVTIGSVRNSKVVVRARDIKSD